MSAAFLPAYQAFLEEHDLSPLSEGLEHYSGVFLPAPLAAYEQSTFRLMIVGQETRGWNGKLARLDAARTSASLGDYVDEGVEVYLKRRQRKPGRSRFLQFLHQAERQLGLSKHAVHWANLYACDYLRRSPRRRPADELSALTKLSVDLLALQIRELKPQAILFTTGPGCDAVLGGMSHQHFGGYENSVVHTPRKLWSFTMGGVPCFRTTHPRYLRDNSFRQQALAMIQAQREPTGDDNKVAG